MGFTRFAYNKTDSKSGILGYFLNTIPSVSTSETRSPSDYFAHIECFDCGAIFLEDRLVGSIFGRVM